jgi:E3 ubiquitin-protein ligase Arkadia
VLLQKYFDDLLRYIPNVDQSEALCEFLCSMDDTAMDYDALLDLEQALGNVSEEVPLTSQEIGSLPCRSSNLSSSSAAEMCVICQEELVDHEDVRMLPCKHAYHFQCISQWLHEKNSCCICHCVAVRRDSEVKADE